MSADPFHSLRLPDEPRQPRSEFAEALRARIASSLGIQAPTPPRGAAVTATPYLTCRGASDAIAFYVAVFGAVEVGSRYVDHADGKVGHAELMFGDTKVMLSDEYAEMGVVSPTTLGGTSFAMTLQVDDVDAAHAAAVAAGSRTLREPADQPYGMRAATVIDPWGHRWTLNTPVHDRPLPAMEGFELVHARPAPLGYFTVRVADVGRAAAFYGALFGWQVDGNGHIANIDPPGGFVADSPDAVTLYLQVQDIGAAMARVRELGGSVVSSATYESGPNARCTDDQGNVFELFQPNPGYERH